MWTGKNSGDRLAAIALEKGLKRNEANGQLKRYMDKLYFTNPDAGNIRIYAEKVWIFSEDKLVTVLEFPKVLRIKPIRKSKENQERRIIWETKNT